MYISTLDDIKTARERITPYIHRTPIFTSEFLNDLTGAKLLFKCENFQKGVAAHSSGNHALSLSYAAGRRGIPCHVVMPRTAPQAQKDAVRGYGGIITECEPSTRSREEVFAKIEAETGAAFVHPYNDPRVIAGQATCSAELIEQVAGLDAVVAPCAW